VGWVSVGWVSVGSVSVVEQVLGADNPHHGFEGPRVAVLGEHLLQGEHRVGDGPADAAEVASLGGHRRGRPGVADEPPQEGEVTTSLGQPDGGVTQRVEVHGVVAGSPVDGVRLRGRGGRHTITLGGAA